MIFRSGSVSAGSLVGGILTGFPNQFDKIFLVDFISSIPVEHNFKNLPAHPEPEPFDSSTGNLEGAPQ